MTSQVMDARSKPSLRLRNSLNPYDLSVPELENAGPLAAPEKDWSVASTIRLARTGLITRKRMSVILLATRLSHSVSSEPHGEVIAKNRPVDRVGKMGHTTRDRRWEKS